MKRTINQQARALSDDSYGAFYCEICGEVMDNMTAAEWKALGCAHERCQKSETDSAAPANPPRRSSRSARGARRRHHPRPQARARRHKR